MFSLSHTATVIAQREASKPVATSKSASKSTPRTPRLHSHVEGDAEGTRRCTHPLHVGERLMARDGNFYRYPDKPDTPPAFGSWCGTCRKSDAKAKKIARQTASTPRDYSAARGAIESVTVDAAETALVNA